MTEWTVTTPDWDEVDQFVAATPGGCYIQSGWFNRAQETRGADIIRLGARDVAGTLVATACVTVRRGRSRIRTATCFKGPVLDWSDRDLAAWFLDQLNAACRSRRVARLQFSPPVLRVGRDADGAITADFDHHDLHEWLLARGCSHRGYAMDMVDCNWTFVKSLPEGATWRDIAAGLSKPTRKSITRADVRGHTVVRHGADDADTFHRALQRSAEARGYAPHSADYYRTLARVGGDHVQLLTAELDVAAYRARLREELATIEADLAAARASSSPKAAGKITTAEELLASRTAQLSELGRLDGVITTAALAFLVHGDEVVAFVGGADPDYATRNGMALLHEHVLRWALEHGIHRYNFWGTYGIAHPDMTGHGNYLFKKGFGGAVEQYLGSYDVDVIAPLAAADRLVVRLLRRGARLTLPCPVDPDAGTR